MKTKTPKLINVKRLDSIRLDTNDKTYFTNEGYLVDHPILTSVGIFEYTNDDGSIRRELRLPEYVFEKKSLESYKGKPIIITHDAGLIDKNNVDEEQVGTILSNGYEDGENVRAEIIIHNTDEMKKRALKELSLGYSLDLIEEAGTWNGEEYDAIQTNIVINHLALVETARAGEKARLNIDGSEKPRTKGEGTMKKDGEVLTPEELEEAIEMYKKSKSDGEDEKKTSGAENAEEENKDENKEENAEEANKEENADEAESVGKTPNDILEEVKKRKEENKEETDKEKIDRQDADLDMLLACLEKFIAEEKAEGSHDDSDDTEAKKENAEEENKDEDKEENKQENKEENVDGCEDKSKSMNNDSIDEIVRQRLEICRVGDKLNLDGLEHKSIKDAKKKIINKVMPTMRLDGKTETYINALYDMSLNEIYKRKTVDDQYKQMSNKAVNMDGNNERQKNGALSARQRMIERLEGGNE